MDSENTDDIIELHASPNRKNEEEESIEKSEESVYADAHDETFKDSTQNEIINEDQAWVFPFFSVINYDSLFISSVTAQ